MPKQKQQLEPRPKPERPPPPPPSTWQVTLVGDAQPLEVMATTAVISTAGVLAFNGGPDDQKLLRALAAGELRRVKLSATHDLAHPPRHAAHRPEALREHAVPPQLMNFKSCDFSALTHALQCGLLPV